MRNKLVRKSLFSQIKSAWNCSIIISKQTNKSRRVVFKDIVYFYWKYYVFSNQYVSNNLWKLQNSEKVELAKNIGEINHKHDNWLIDKYNNRRFIEKWSSLTWDSSPKKVKKRNEAYTKQFNTGKGLGVQHNVDIHREHFLEGRITIGNHVYLAKNVFIDYSGEVIIDDNVKIANGACFETHHRDLEAYQQGLNVNIPTSLHICEGAYIGTRAIILDSCNYIGKYSRIGAGAVVTKDIPDYSVAVGVPAKIVKTIEQINS